MHSCASVKFELIVFTGCLMYSDGLQIAARLITTSDCLISSRSFAGSLTMSICVNENRPAHFFSAPSSCWILSGDTMSQPSTFHVRSRMIFSRRCEPMKPATPMMQTVFSSDIGSGRGIFIGREARSLRPPASAGATGTHQEPRREVRPADGGQRVVELGARARASLCGRRVAAASF